MDVVGGGEMIKTEQLYYLTQVAKYNSINKAAENLYMTSAAVSTAMKQLEKECDYAILERTYRGVKLTDKGKQVVKLAEQILALHNEILNMGKEKIVRKHYKLLIDRSTLKLLSNKIVGPQAHVLEHFILKEVNAIHMNYYENLEENTVLLMTLTDENRETFEKDDRISVRYLYASKQYPVSSKNTKYIKENAKQISLKEFEKLPKIKIRSEYDMLEKNIVLATDDATVYAEAIQNDYGVGLITKFAPDIFSIDSSKFKIYEPFDKEVYVAMVAQKGYGTSAMTLLEQLIKG